jgi:hypothetical protein
MSRISSSSFKVNSDLEQLVNITNTSLAVSDATAQGSLSTLAGAITLSQMNVASSELSTIAGAVSGSEMQVDIVSAPTIAVSNTDLATVAGAVSGSEMQVDIVSSATIAVSNTDLATVAGAVSGSEMQVDIVSSSGTIDVSDSTAQGSLSTLAGTVSGGRVLVTTESGSANNSGSKGNLSNAASVSAGTFSSEIDVRSSKNLTIFGVSNDTSNQIEIHVSANSGSDYVKYQYGMFPDSSGNFSTSLPNVAINYIKLKYTGTATVTASLLHN